MDRALAPSLAVCSAQALAPSGAVALAACAFELPQPPAEGAAPVIEMQLTPVGAFRPSDGRELPVDHWYIDAAVAARVIARFDTRTNPVVVDYEHQTLNKEENGQPAPAAAWIHQLHWREGSGLWATAELTARAAASIKAREYRYVSPVFVFDPVTGEVLAILMAAITNNPAIDGMAPLEVAAAATFGFTHPSKELPTVNKLLAALCAVLGLDPATTTEDQAVAACTALKAKLEAADQARTALGVADGADGAAMVAACTALKAQATAAASATPDPAKYTPNGVVEEMKAQIAALTSKNTDREVAELVEAGLADGRLHEAQRAWAMDLGRHDVAQLSAYLKATPAIAALSGSQTRGQAPAGATDENGLTAAELAVCTATGVSPKDFAAAKA